MIVLKGVDAVRQPHGKCVVNRDLVPDLAMLTGTRDEMSQRLGISWNSWIKIAGGLPIRTTLALRLRSRVLAQAHMIDSLREKFPCASAPDRIDHAALERAFLRPAAGASAQCVPTFRSVRRAMAFADSQSARQ